MVILFFMRGIANISCVLPNRVVAFDISPANQLLNVLANRLGYEYDEDGKIAASGTIELLFIINPTPNH